MFPSGTLNPSTWNYGNTTTPGSINYYCNSSESFTQAFGSYNIDHRA
jgi:hypothetical protein